MKRVLFAAVLLVLFGAARAQKVYFIYIQSEGSTPFFVKLGDKVTSSTASGYLILPKLVDSTYSFSVGKTGDAAVESRFSVIINKKDRGFLLKESAGRFGLFDLQSLTLLSPLASANVSGDAVAKRTDAFTVLLAQAANDPSLLEIRTAAAITTSQAEEAKKDEPVPAVARTTNGPEITFPQSENKDSVMNAETIETATTTDNTNKDDISQNDTATAKAAKTLDNESKDEIIKSETGTDTAQLQEQTAGKESEPSQSIAPEETKTYKRSVVTRKSESSTSEGFGLTFLDVAEGATDTIRIVIPNQSTVLQKETGNNEDSKKFLNITNDDTSRTAVTVDAANETIRVAETKKRKACAVAATEREFFKLRKNMAAEESDNAMVNEAQKAFKRSCFSTGQIKNLGSLFLTASAKYHFFDAAYGHVSDPEQYVVLQGELNDDYYVNRFKALIAKQ